MAQQTTAHESGGYEKRDVNIRNLVLIAVICIVVVVAATFWVWTYFVRVTEETVYQSVLKPGSLTLQELHAREDNVLNKYRIIDTAKGIYQIPIDSAIEIIAREAARALSGP